MPRDQLHPGSLSLSRWGGKKRDPGNEVEPVLSGLFIFSNIKNAAGNIAGTLPDDFGSGSDENKNMYRESE